MTPEQWKALVQAQMDYIAMQLGLPHKPLGKRAK